MILYKKGGKINRVPLSQTEYEEIKERFGEIQCSIGKTDKGEFYAYTHRARSKFYPSISKLPSKVVEFISSTS